MERGSWLLPTLLTFVLSSGFAALVYQVLWLRLLALVFGVTVWAASTVLAAFMAGLALGSFVASRYSDRTRRPLRWYGIVEIGIGVSALLTVPALQLVERAYVAVAPAIGEDLGAVTALRVALSSLILLVPTALMGATLPLVVRAAMTHGAGVGERISVLYATNTLGAIAGVLLAGLVLVGGIGLGASFGLAAAVNLAVGVAAIALASRLGRGAAPEATAPAVEVRAEPVSPGAARALLLVFTLSGFASFALEVVWFRILVFYVAATTYAFTIMLAAVLAGIAAGSFLAALLIRRGMATLRTLAVVELALGAASLFSLAILGLSGVLARAPAGTDGEQGAGGLATAVSLLLALGALLPATLLFGVAFPLGLALWIGRDGGTRVGERLGVFYGLNVLGAIAGSLCAGFLLLPTIGSQASIVVAALVSTASGLLLLALVPRGRGAVLRRIGVAAGGVAALVVALIVAPDPFAGALERRFPGHQVLWREEGVQSTVSLHRAADGHRLLYLDGLHQANDRPDMIRTHRTIGHLPMALHPAPRRVLVVGLGGGVTAGAVARHADAQVEIVELSPGVIAAARLFADANEGVLDRPNVRVRIDDARNHLLLRTGPYDVITADIILPQHAGAGNVYSVEYFHLVRRALADDGIALQWIGQFPETQHKLIMRTFLSAFPEATLWAEGTLMVGTKRPLALDRAAIERRLADARIADALAGVGIRDVASLLALYWGGPDEMRAYVGPGPILTDDRPQVEYFLSLPVGEAPPDVRRIRGGSVERHVRR